jgi:hypothetical protein
MIILNGYLFYNFKVKSKEDTLFSKSLKHKYKKLNISSVITGFFNILTVPVMLTGEKI